jgi:hypothetical protein
MREPTAVDVEAEAALPDARYERKFLAPRLRLGDILAAVSVHPAAFRRTYPDRIVNNIYLDTPSLQDYVAHVSGARRRSKTRIRWYGGLDAPAETPVLERKIKWAGVGGKQSHALPPFHAGPAWVSRHIREALDGVGLPDALRLFLRHLEPVVLNRYRRHYFESADGRFRLTVDSDLQLHAIPRIGRALGPPLRLGAEIVEVKYAPRHAEGAPEVTCRLPFRLARYSKYVTAIELMRGL